MAVLYSWWPFSGRQTDGQLGDSFGVLTSLFNGLAFAGLIITVVLQSRELSLQRLELQETRQQLASQADSLRSQNTLAFYFELMRERREIIAAYENLAGTFRGRKAFLEDAIALRVHASRLAAPFGRKAFGEQIWGWLIDRLALIQPLISVHLEMLRLISATGEDNGTRPLANRLSESYANMLTSAEAGVLFYFGLTPSGKRELVELIETHAIFRNRSREELSNFVEFGHLNYYTQRAYGRVAPWTGAPVPADE